MGGHEEEETKGEEEEKEEERMYKVESSKPRKCREKEAARGAGGQGARGMCVGGKQGLW